MSSQVASRSYRRSKCNGSAGTKVATQGFPLNGSIRRVVWKTSATAVRKSVAAYSTASGCSPRGGEWGSQRVEASGPYDRNSSHRDGRGPLVLWMRQRSSDVGRRSLASTSRRGGRVGFFVVLRTPGPQAGRPRRPGPHRRRGMPLGHGRRVPQLASSSLSLRPADVRTGESGGECRQTRQDLAVRELPPKVTTRTTDLDAEERG